MEKIIIIGSPGAGKSTFSFKLQEKTGLPLYHLDKLFWKPGWVLSEREEQIAIQKDLFKKKQWIIDGNYGGTLEMRIEACDTIFFIDTPRWRCMYHVLKRNKQYKNTSRPDMNEGCPEKIDLDFLKWTWNFKHKQRVDLIKQVNGAYRHKQVIVLKNQKEINDYLKGKKRD
ncbi:DNA topology modulation protein [Vagococcus hydrophili]|uniref:DNA topology modulation protein n=1 Tax=Vagococcus hydrophili TaxID=2714947 RepID=A0A6G8AU05_9ENTE|nr:DNA topology modulation protein [Vagococcus hydrophili]QIL48403.1 DNA topology modulation protein [Vagococcus hydrophili]